MSKSTIRDSSLPPLARVLPTRVRRNYRGGLLLDRLENEPTPRDSDRPESWIASTTRARNPGMEAEADEGLTRLQLADGTQTNLSALIATAPDFYLGSVHASRSRHELGFLAKLLDSAMRLHVQAHPTAAFARQNLGSEFGKLEVYYVLAVREKSAGTIRLGFQHSPGRDGWRRIIETQDIAAMDACFDPISVKPGDLWIVPGGMPHAIGEGVLMVEVMEPSDWVVRCEFEREGIIVPPEGRFMNRGLDFCLDIFDYASLSVAEIRDRCQLTPKPLAGGAGWTLEQVVGSNRTQCFEIQRLRASTECVLSFDGRPKIVIQTLGDGIVSSAQDSVALHFGSSCFAAAQAPALRFSPSGQGSEWLICSPNILPPI